MFSFLFGVNAGRSMFNTVGNLSPKQNTIHNVLILKYTTSLYAVDSSGQQLRLQGLGDPQLGLVPALARLEL